MKKILAIIIISITILVCGCGTYSSASNNKEYALARWGVDTYKADNGKEYYVFTTSQGSIFVVEK